MAGRTLDQLGKGVLMEIEISPVEPIKSTDFIGPQL